MYLSQLILDPRSRSVINNLADPYQLHRTLMGAFPETLPKGERVLYRVEQQRKIPYLSVLVQSGTLPDWRYLSERGYLLLPASVKTFDLHPSTGHIFRFRLLANPTKRLKSSDDANGPRVGLVRSEEQCAWLERKAGQNGFCVLEVQTLKTVQPDAVKREKNKVHHIHCEAVRFDGLLQVVNPELFKVGLVCGIGSGKGFGFGLLSLAPAG
ncbi:type I-E CRISPR-associated protein Cas6/Cse3/CasE [bacterium]|nr:MAG: type I-E CRISPR-associated protein Cas6/Cse3/CasE [bacterium]